MILFWVTLLLLHQGHMLVPVITIQLGEPATLTCVIPEQSSSNEFHWYKQSAGDSLKLVMKLRIYAEPVYGAEFSPSRVNSTKTDGIITLTISQTVQEDEGIYHCAAIDWTENMWHGTYLSITGNTERTMNYAVIHQSTVSKVHPGLQTLQCSVLSDSDVCSNDIQVFWFRARADKSYPEFIYTDGNRHNECETEPNSQKRCVFSKNISSTNAGTYYCAVATCGQILFGNGTTLEVEPTTDVHFTVLVITVSCLVISMIVNIVFIYSGTSRAACKQSNVKENVSSQARHDTLDKTGDHTTESGKDLNYAALRFSEHKRKREKTTEESIYSQVKF